MEADMTDKPHDWRDHSSSPHHHVEGDPEPVWDAVRVAAPSDGWTDLANDIRTVDGNHDLGAGELAARLAERGWRRVAAPSDGLRERIERLSDASEGRGEWLTGWQAAIEATLDVVDAARVAAPSDGLRAMGGLSAQVSAILFGAVDDETFERVMGAIRRTEAFADLDLYRALQPSWHEALMTYDPPDPIPAGGWSRLMPHTDEAIRIFAALRAALSEHPDE
jgi:hypothetical protein